MRNAQCADQGRMTPPVTMPQDVTMTEAVTMTREVIRQTGPGLMSRGPRTPCQYMAQLTATVTDGQKDQATIGSGQERPYRYP